MVLVAGCSDDRATTKNPTVEGIWKEIEQAVDVSDMRKGYDEDLKELYDIDANDIEEYILYTAPSNIEADEIAIIKVKAKDDLKEVENKIGRRVEALGTSFKDYIPEEYYLIEKHIVNTKQNYVLFVVSERADEIADVFDSCFK